MLRLRTLRALGHGQRTAASSPLHSPAACFSVSAEAQVHEVPASSLFSPASPEVETVHSFHERTKHTFERYAETPATPDLAKQPYQFRYYSGCQPRPIPLRHLPPMPNNPQDQAYTRIFSDFFSPLIITKAAISQLFYDTFAVCNWRQAGEQFWGLRSFPSCGNLHPLEGYLVCGNMLGISDKPFVAHYNPKDHMFGIRTTFPFDLWNELRMDLPEDAFFVAITSINWRTTWRFGERGYRYVHLDAGHAIGALSIAASSEGWDVQVVDGFGPKDLDVLLGLPQHKQMPPSTPKRGYYPELEHERSVCLLCVHSGRRKVHHEYNTRATELVKIVNAALPTQSFLNSMRVTMPKMTWTGEPIPKEMNNEHVYYEWIDKAHDAMARPSTTEIVNTKPLPQHWTFTHHYKQLTLRQIIHMRRSPSKMDGTHLFEREALYQVMWKAMPSGFNVREQGPTHQFPFRVLPWESEVHLAIMVHRIASLTKGLYFVVRNVKHEQQLRQALRPEFVWQKPEKCPDCLPLYKLADADMEKLVKQTSCFQDIGGDGCFTVIMLARYNSLNDKGAWMYPRLHWECGVLGQLLSMEAHSMGLSSCGVGCFFDDPVHEILGLKGKEFQCLYLYSFGAAAPEEDKRIHMSPPYPSPDFDELWEKRELKICKKVREAAAAAAAAASGSSAS